MKLCTYLRNYAIASQTLKFATRQHRDEPLECIAIKFINRSSIKYVSVYNVKLNIVLANKCFIIAFKILFNKWSNKNQILEFNKMQLSDSTCDPLKILQNTLLIALLIFLYCFLFKYQHFSNISVSLELDIVQNRS